MMEPGGPASVEKPSSPRLREDVPIRVLVVDDEVGVRNAVLRILRNAGMNPISAEDGVRAFELLESGPIDVVVLDVRMPGMTGPQVLSRMKAERHPAEVIMMTAFADITTTVSAVKEGAYGFLTKPFAANESIVIEVLNAAAHKRLRERTERLQRELAALRVVLDQIQPEASAPASLGEGRTSKTIAGVVTSLSLHELPYAEAKRRLVANFTEAYVRSLLEITSGDLSEAARRSGLDSTNFTRLVKPGTPPDDG